MLNTEVLLGKQCSLPSQSYILQGIQTLGSYTIYCLIIIVIYVISIIHKFLLFLPNINSLTGEIFFDTEVLQVAKTLQYTSNTHIY